LFKIGFGDRLDRVTNDAQRNLGPRTSQIKKEARSPRASPFKKKGRLEKPDDP
jgi:hypothetical protein